MLLRGLFKSGEDMWGEELLKTWSHFQIIRRCGDVENTRETLNFILVSGIALLKTIAISGHF